MFKLHCKHCPDIVTPIIRDFAGKKIAVCPNCTCEIKTLSRHEFALWCASQRFSLSDSGWVQPELAEILKDQMIWSNQTFGSGRRSEGILQHIEREVAEVRENPMILEEWIDLVLLALDGAWRCRKNNLPSSDDEIRHDVVRMLIEKQAKNRVRLWPTPVDDDTPTEHIRTEVEETVACEQQITKCFRAVVHKIENVGDYAYTTGFKTARIVVIPPEFVCNKVLVSAIEEVGE